MLHLLMFFVSLAVRTIKALCRSHADLVIENLALQQQVVTLKKQQPRPALVGRPLADGKRRWTGSPAPTTDVF
jgi:hypothetical protein